MARRKITASVDPDDAVELPELTLNQQEFVRLLLAGESGADAYRGAYDCSTMSKQAIWVEASRLRNNPKVALWIGAARKAHFGTATVTLNDHVRELERLKEIALETGNVGAAVQAEQLRGKAAGHYVDKLENVTKHHDPAHTINEIANLMGEEYAAQLAHKSGVTWQPTNNSGTKH